MATLPNPHPNHLPDKLNIETHLYNYNPTLDYEDTRIQIPEACWSGHDQSGRQIYIKQGMLFAISNMGNHILLRDFNPEKVNNIPPPNWAKQWPEF